jgi:hypothetical protein
MPFALLLIGIILIVAAYNSAQGQLFSAVEQDIPGFFKWGVAIAAILGAGFVPGLRTPSRWLLGLVLLVIFLKNYQNILDGFTTFAQSGSGQTGQGAATATPTDAFTASAGQSTAPVTEQQIAGDAGSGASGATPAASAGSQIASAATTFGSLAQGGFNPSSVISSLESGFGGAFGVG